MKYYFFPIVLSSMLSRYVSTEELQILCSAVVSIVTVYITRKFGDYINKRKK